MPKLRYAWRLLGEFLGFARHHRAYWIIPLVLMLAITGLAVVTSQAGAPLIYALF